MYSIFYKHNLVNAFLVGIAFIMLLPLVAFGQITSVEVSTRPIENEGLTQRISPLGELENHNVIVKLETPHEIIGFYGLRKPVDQLVLHLDEPEEFRAAVSQRGHG